VAHTLIHVIPRRTGVTAALRTCSEWIDDDGLVP
jgi:hypothetical protein